MQLLSVKQMQQWDAWTIEHEPIASIQLMERAANQCVTFLEENNLLSHSLQIFCGKGNNGGDGLAIARQLIDRGLEPVVYIMEFGSMGSPDFQENLHRLHGISTNIHFIQTREFFPTIEKTGIVIDALLGLGMDRPLQSLYKEMVEHINRAQAKVISIDLPTGMFCDKSSKGNTILKATYTLSFQAIKLCFLMAENAPYFGYVTILDIGLHPGFFSTIEPMAVLVSEDEAKKMYHPRSAFAHKGSCGHALLIAGSVGKMGAAILSAKACLRSGVGLLTLKVPEEGITIVQTAVPEAMCLNKEGIDLEKYQALGIGPGLGKEDQGLQLLKLLVQTGNPKIVIDADALNLLAENKQLLSNLTSDAVLTPHAKEFDRIFGEMQNDVERFEKAVSLTQQYPFTIVLKGHYSLISKNGKAYFNITGNGGMATGGMGDALTGIIVALLAQGYDSLDAARLGVYIHGLAGDLCLKDQSEESLLPSDLIKSLGAAFQQIQFPHL